MFQQRKFAGLARSIAFGTALIASATIAQSEERDEFFWLGEINKASVIINSEEGLLPKEDTPEIAGALLTVIEAGNEPDGERPSTVISFEPIWIEAGGVEVTLVHAGRSSQDMHATFRAAIQRDKLLELADQLNTTSATMVDLAAEHVDTIVPN